MNYEMIGFWILLVIWLIIFAMTYHKEMPKGEVRANDITFHALILGLIVIMGFVPEAGYIQIFPGISFSLIHLPVLIGASKKGWKGGILYGVAFGVTSWIQAMMSGTGLNAFFAYPWVSILPRTIFGLFAGFAFDLLRKNSKLYKNVLVIGGLSFLLTIMHTVLVFADLFIFFNETMVGLFTSSEPVVEGLTYTFVGVIALGMLGEAILASILTPAVSKALTKVRSNN